MTGSWPDIRRRLEHIEDWQEKGLNELLKEAQRVYLRREEERTKSKAKIMVAVPRESREGGRADPDEEDHKQVMRSWEKRRGPLEGRCYYCDERGHFRNNCKKCMRDEKVFKESQGCKIED